MAITIKDVARESGVNVSTVSRALNGEYGVHAETRELVLRHTCRGLTSFFSAASWARVDLMPA